MKVLTVNFNVIMDSCLRLYDQYVDVDENPTVLWRFLDEEMGLKYHTEYDANLLIKLACIMRDAKHFSNNDIFKTDVICANSPDEYVRIITDKLKELTHVEFLSEIGPVLEMHNIDFNSGVMMPGTNEAIQVTEYDKYNQRSWMNYLFKWNLVSRYTWYKCANSRRISFDKEIADKCSTVVFNNKFATESLEKSLTEGFDCIIFCFDEHWVPYRYKHIYDLINQMLINWNSQVLKEE